MLLQRGTRFEITRSKDGTSSTGWATCTGLVPEVKPATLAHSICAGKPIAGATAVDYRAKADAGGDEDAVAWERSFAADAPPSEETLQDFFKAFAAIYGRKGTRQIDPGTYRIARDGVDLGVVEVMNVGSALAEHWWLLSRTTDAVPLVSAKQTLSLERTGEPDHAGTIAKPPKPPAGGKFAELIVQIWARTKA